MKKTPINIIGWLSIIFLILVLFFSPPLNVEQELITCYYNLCLQIVIFYVLWSVILLKKRVDILEPIVLTTGIHLLLFEITPIICLKTSRILFFGTYVWGACVKATYISTIGYIVLLIAYYNHSSQFTRVKIHQNEILNPKKCLYFNYCVWLFAFLCSVVLILGYGLSLKYILTGGNTIMENEANSKSVFGFLSIFAYAMIPSYIYIFELSNNKFIKVILYYLMFMCFYVRGFRFIMIAAIIAPVIYLYLKKNKRPKLLVVLFILIVLSIFSGYMQFARAAIRAGSGGSIPIEQIFNFDNIVEMLVENFEIFKTYYAIVEHFPKDIPFMLGKEIFLYTTVMLVPRFIWPGKPQPAIYEVISKAVNGSSRDAGTSFPYIGEYYFEFGMLGIIVFMYIFGRLLKKLNNIKSDENIHSRIIYACILPLILQLLIRGYTPTNFYMIMSVIMPVIITDKIVSRIKV